MWNLKRKDTNELTKQKETHRLRKATHGCWGEGIVKDFEGHVHTAIFKMDNKSLLYSTWNSAQCYVAAWMGRGFIGEWVHAYVKAKSLHCSFETIATSLIGYTPIQNVFGVKK